MHYDEVLYYAIWDTETDVAIFLLDHAEAYYRDYAVDMNIESYLDPDFFKGMEDNPVYTSDGFRASYEKFMERYSESPRP